MNRRMISDEELTAASALVIRSMLQSIPESEEVDYVFSADYQSKMAALLRKIKTGRNVVLLSKRIAAVFAAMLIGMTAWLSVDSDARAAFFGWVRKTYANSVVYRYTGESKTDELPIYEFGWLPDGYVEVMNSYNDIHKYAILYYAEPDTDKGIILHYSYMNENSSLIVSGIDSENPYETVKVNGFSGEFYYGTETSPAKSLVWIDTKQNIIFAINSNLDRDVILTVAEQIKISK